MALVGVQFSRESSDRGGQAPALRFARPSPFTVGRGPVPRRASVRETGFGWRAFFAQIERSRGTGPHATGPEGVLLKVRRTLMSIARADAIPFKVL